jgi:hypothetical protein
VSAWRASQLQGRPADTPPVLSIAPCDTQPRELNACCNLLCHPGTQQHNHNLTNGNGNTAPDNRRIHNRRQYLFCLCTLGWQQHPRGSVTLPPALRPSCTTLLNTHVSQHHPTPTPRRGPTFIRCRPLQGYGSRQCCACGAALQSAAALQISHLLGPPQAQQPTLHATVWRSPPPLPATAHSSLHLLHGCIRCTVIMQGRHVDT